MLELVALAAYGLLVWRIARWWFGQDRLTLEEQGRQALEEDRTDCAHVYPHRDSIEHVADVDGNCPCIPELEVVWRADGSNGWLYVHREVG